MKKIELGQIITILANIGVIAGIVFLAIELQQNNKLLEAQAISVVLETRMVRVEQVAESEGLAQLQTKNNAMEPLSDVERTRMEALHARSLMGWQRDYFLFQEGILPERLLRSNFPLMRAAFAPKTQSLGHYEHWIEIWQDYAAPEFREFIEKCILSDCETIPR